MNDEFLRQFRKQPEPEFAAALYKRISRQRPSVLSRWIDVSPAVRTGAIVLLVLMLIAACVRIITNIDHWQKVGSVWVKVQSNYSVDIPTAAPGNSAVQVFSMGPMSPPQADKTLGFHVALPAWAPVGFTSDDRLVLLDWSSGYAAWNSAGDARIDLAFQSLQYWNPALQSYAVKDARTPPVAPGSFAEVQIDGRPAVLVRGDWVVTPPGAGSGQHSLKWDSRAGLWLIWSRDDVQYWLWTADRSVTAEELIRMAASAQ